MVLSDATQRDICRAMGFSLVAMQHLFKREFGMSFTQWRKERA